MGSIILDPEAKQEVKGFNSSILMDAKGSSFFR